MSLPAESICETVKIPTGCVERFLPLGHGSDDVLRRSGVGMGGHSHLVPGYLIARIAPAYHVLISTITGEGELHTIDGVQRVEEGSQILLPAGATYSYVLHRGSWEIAWLHLSARRRWRNVSPDITLSRTSSSWLADGILGALGVTGREDLIGKRAFAAYAQLILAGVEEALGGVAVPPPTLLKLTASIDSRLAEPWTVSMMARAAHQSESTLARLFRRHFGMAPMKWLASRRMERAAALLLRGHEPAYIIAELVGYGDPFAFSVAFKRWCGRSPTDYRRASQA